MLPLSARLPARVAGTPGAPLLALVLLGGTAGWLEADIIHLKSGRTLEGTVADGAKKGTLEIRTGEGTKVIVPAGDVLRIERRQSPQEEFDARFGRVAPGDVAALEDLVVWARDRQISGRARTAARKILETDANNELARKELGYVVFENRWLLESELKKRSDLVRHRGEWMTAADKKRREAEEAVAEMEEMLALLANDNRHIQEFALQKLLAVREPAARDVFARHLGGPSDSARWVAVRGLANFTVKGEGDAPAREIASELHRRAMAEKHEKSLEIYFYTLARFFPEESRRLAAEEARNAASEPERRRAREIVERLSRRPR